METRYGKHEMGNMRWETDRRQKTEETEDRGDRRLRRQKTEETED